MAKSLIDETICAMSTSPEASFNGMVVLASGMTAFKTRSRGLPIPDDEKTDDSGEIGGGLNAGEFPMEQYSGFIITPTWEISNIVDAGIFVKQLRRFLGAADPVPAGGSIIEAGIAFRHVMAMLANNTAAGRQLPSSSFAYSNNGLDYQYGGGVANTLNVTQQGAADPTYSFGYVSSGLYKRIRDISPAYGNLAAPAAQPKMKGAETSLQFTDPTGLLSLTAARRLVNITWTANNAIETGQRLAGSPRVDPLDMTKGWYLPELLHNRRTAGAEMRIFLDDNMREFSDARNNSIITGFTLKMLGYAIPTTAADNHFSTSLIFGKSYFRSVRTNDDNGNAVLDIGVFPVADGINFGVMTAEAVNNVATSIA